MRTVHSILPHSAEMCFIDSTGNLDRHGCRVFVLLTHNVAGGVPLGIIVTTSESKEIICEGLELLKSILPDDAFRGCGLQGLHMFLTDDSTSERQAIHRPFPQTILMLCIFHLLQALWRWLWDGIHNIKKENRPELFGLVKDMVFAEDMDDIKRK